MSILAVDVGAEKVESVPHAFVTRKILPIAAAGAGSVIAGIESVNVGAIVGLLTGVSFAVIGVVVYAIKNIGPTWEEYQAFKCKRRAEAKAEVDRLLKDSLTFKMEAMKESQDQTVQSLAGLRRHYDEDMIRHNGESARLTRQLEFLTRVLEATKDELCNTQDRLSEVQRDNEHLLTQVSFTVQKTEVNTEKIKQLEVKSSDGE